MGPVHWPHSLLCKNSKPNIQHHSAPGFNFLTHTHFVFTPRARPWSWSLSVLWLLSNNKHRFKWTLIIRPALSNKLHMLVKDSQWDAGGNRLSKTEDWIRHMSWTLPWLWLSDLKTEAQLYICTHELKRKVSRRGQCYPTVHLPTHLFRFYFTSASRFCSRFGGFLIDCCPKSVRRR